MLLNHNVSVHKTVMIYTIKTILKLNVYLYRTVSELGALSYRPTYSTYVVINYPHNRSYNYGSDVGLKVV